jgi:hypothetical protein
MQKYAGVEFEGRSEPKRRLWVGHSVLGDLIV